MRKIVKNPKQENKRLIYNSVGIDNYFGIFGFSILENQKYEEE